MRSKNSDKWTYEYYLILYRSTTRNEIILKFQKDVIFLFMPFSYQRVICTRIILVSFTTTPSDSIGRKLSTGMYIYPFDVSVVSASFRLHQTCQSILTWCIQMKPAVYRTWNKDVRPVNVYLVNSPYHWTLPIYLLSKQIHILWPLKSNDFAKRLFITQH